MCSVCENELSCILDVSTAHITPQKYAYVMFLCAVGGYLRMSHRDGDAAPVSTSEASPKGIVLRHNPAAV